MLYKREQDDAFIHIVEVNKSEEDNVVSEAIYSPGKGTKVSAAGKKGHNIMFSTNKSLITILDEFSPFFCPDSEIHADDEEIGYRKFRLKDVPRGTFERISKEEKGMWLGILQDKNPDKLHLFNYATLSPSQKVSAYFGINLQYYDQDMMEVCYKLTNYKLTKEDTNWIKSFIKEPE